MSSIELPQDVPDHDACLDITVRMYQDAMRLVRSDIPYFTIRGRQLLAEVHNMLLSQRPDLELPHLVDVV